jgi:hypothetical protein
MAESWIARCGASVREIRAHLRAVKRGSYVAPSLGLFGVRSGGREARRCREEFRAEQAWQPGRLGFPWVSARGGAINCGVSNAWHRGRKALVPARRAPGEKALSRVVASGRRERVAEVDCQG